MIEQWKKFLYLLLRSFEVIKLLMGHLREKNRCNNCLKPYLINLDDVLSFTYHTPWIKFHSPISHLHFAELYIF